jgi:hypothetical protein
LFADGDVLTPLMNVPVKAVPNRAPVHAAMDTHDVVAQLRKKKNKMTAAKADK